jgi:hypothetical protein
MIHPSVAKPSPDCQTALIDLRAQQCRFVVSEELRDAVCCGAPTSETSSWCPYHRQLVFIPRSERDRRRAA